MREALGRILAVDVESADPIVVYVLQDGCGGTEIDCRVGTYSATTDRYSTSVTIPGTGVNHTYVVAIERGPSIPPVSPFKFTYQARVF